MQAHWRQIGAVALAILGLMPQLSEACVTVYMDNNVDATQQEVQAWAFVEDCLNMGGSYPPYFAHLYYAAVHIDSPTQNSAGAHEEVGPIPYAGGSADAYAAISYDEDSGVYHIETEVWIACSLIGYFLGQLEDHTVQAPVCTPGSTDSAAVGVTLMWPVKEPWERGVLLFCEGPNVYTFGYYGDSFGQFYGGFGYSNDPCAVTWNLAVSSSLVAIAHSHPWFDSLSEYRGGDDCLHDHNYHTYNELQYYNNVTNVKASDNDKALSNTKGVPIYTRSPSGTQVHKYLQGSEPQVYP